MSSTTTTPSASTTEANRARRARTRQSREPGQVSAFKAEHVPASELHVGQVVGSTKAEALTKKLVLEGVKAGPKAVTLTVKGRAGVWKRPGKSVLVWALVPTEPPASGPGTSVPPAPAAQLPAALQALADKLATNPGAGLSGKDQKALDKEGYTLRGGKLVKKATRAASGNGNGTARTPLTPEQEAHMAKANALLKDSGYADQLVPRHARAWATWAAPKLGKDGIMPKAAVQAWAKGTRPEGEQAKALLAHMEAQRAANDSGKFAIWARPYCAWLVVTGAAK